ncbi:MAG: ATP-dependent metallopeptidase FtsH/Yme1/Tma family protein, partial [Clostridia bacterium]
MVAKKNNNNKRTLLIIISAVLLIVLLYSIYAVNKNDKRINYTEFKQMVKTEQVSEVYINNYTI